MNYLKAVFWDYPQFTRPDYLHQYLNDRKGKETYFWVMRRFLENGRVVDALQYFTIEEIAEKLLDLNLTAYTLKKWRRMVEVYGTPHRI